MMSVCVFGVGVGGTDLQLTPILITDHPSYVDACWGHAVFHVLVSVRFEWFVYSRFTIS